MAVPTPAALRAMRGALNWTMRDTAEAASVALATVLKAEQGGEVTPRTLERLRAAFRRRGVTLWTTKGVQSVRILEGSAVRKLQTPTEIAGLPYVVARKRADGSWRVLFEVPERSRAIGWPATRPLPWSHPRRGDMTDKAEVAAIRADAASLLRQLETARLKGGKDRR